MKNADEIAIEPYHKGQKIGEYVVQKHITSGGLGHIYLCKRHKWGRSFAVKTPKTTSDNVRFEREAKVNSKLSHDNIVKVFEIGTNSDSMFIAMEYLNGTTLKEALKRREGYDYFYSVLHQTLAAVSYFHNEGFIHRDLKPENIFVLKKSAFSNKPVVKLIDFGLVRELDPDKTKITKAGTVVGTPGYMSPEQSQGQETDERDDVWACGALIEKMLRHLEDSNPTASTQEQTSSQINSFSDIAKKCKEDKTSRYQNITELLADVKKVNKVRPNQQKSKVKLVVVLVGVALAVLLTVLLRPKESTDKNSYQTKTETITVKNKEDNTPPISLPAVDDTISNCEKALSLSSNDDEPVAIERLGILGQCYAVPGIDINKIADVAYSFIKESLKAEPRDNVDRKAVIQIALNVFGQRDSGEQYFEFIDMDLSGYTFTGNFSGIHFRSVDLTKAKFDNANLDGATGDFDCARCRFQNGTTIRGIDDARLTMFNGQYAHFEEGTIADGLKVDKAKFQFASFNGVSFIGADLKGAMFNDVKTMANVNMQRADISWARFCGAVIDRLNVKGAKVQGAEIACAKSNTRLINGRKVKGRWGKTIPPLSTSSP